MGLRGTVSRESRKLFSSRYHSDQTQLDRLPQWWKASCDTNEIFYPVEKISMRSLELILLNPFLDSSTSMLQDTTIDLIFVMLIHGDNLK